MYVSVTSETHLLNTRGEKLFQVPTMDMNV